MMSTGGQGRSQSPGQRRCVGSDWEPSPLGTVRSFTHSCKQPAAGFLGQEEHWFPGKNTALDGPDSSIRDVGTYLASSKHCPGTFLRGVR